MLMETYPLNTQHLTVGHVEAVMLISRLGDVARLQRRLFLPRGRYWYVTTVTSANNRCADAPPGWQARSWTYCSKHVAHQPVAVQ